jgi:cytochrome c-type biogenesis protein CcmH
MLTFYLIAGGVAVITTFLIVRPLIAGRHEAEGHDEASTQIFRDQLDEIDRDLGRGTISEAEAEGARVEVSRRLLAASGRARAAEALVPAPQGHSGLIAGLAMMGTPALAAALYIGLGAPGAEDQPLAERRGAAQSQAQAPLPSDHPELNRPTQEEAEAEIAASTPPAPQAADDPEYLELVERLEGMIETRPNDQEGHRLLANGLMRLGRWSEAWRVYDKLLALIDGVPNAEIHASKAEAMVLAAGGYVSPGAERAIGEALQIDPTLPMARYYAGLALRQAGQLDDAVTMWEGLRRDSPPDAPYLEWLNMMLAETVRARDGTPPRGPSQDDIAAANDMPEDDRNAMIEGMVQRLADRLAKQGGSPQEWAQLMASYATLNRTEEAEQTLELALAAYPDGTDAEALRAHAGRLGIAGGTSVPAATAPGPTQEDINAAQQMSSEDRATMIEGMVARLEDRLTTDGGLAEDWLRLIRSYVQLERMDDAARVYKLAEVALSNDPSRGFVKEQSLLMGVPTE